MAENDLISRKALLDTLKDINETDYGSMSDYRAHMAVGNALRDVCRVVDAAPSVEAEPSCWDVFDDITSFYYGKQMYFSQSDGTIYSRLSCGYMSFEEALSEFCEAIAKEDE